MNSTEVLNQTTALLEHPENANGLEVSDLLSLLQQVDPTVTRGQVLNLLNKVKCRKVKDIAVTLSQKGRQLFIKADAFHKFQVDFNTAYKNLANQAQVIDSQLTEDQREAVSAAIKTMQQHYTYYE